MQPTDWFRIAFPFFLLQCTWIFYKVGSLSNLGEFLTLISSEQCLWGWWGIFMIFANLCTSLIRYFFTVRNRFLLGIPDNWVVFCIVNESTKTVASEIINTGAISRLIKNMNTGKFTICIELRFFIPPVSADRYKTYVFFNYAGIISYINYCSLQWPKLHVCCTSCIGFKIL